MSHSPADIQKALDLSKKIEAKAHNVLVALELEMRVMKWEPEYCAIMWECVGRKAMQRAKDASK